MRTPASCSPRVADAAARAVPSPAALLQDQLAEEWVEGGKWPLASRLAFIAVTCGGFWGLAAVAARALIR